MLANGLASSSHKGIKTLLGLHFVKTGKIDPQYGRIYQQLFENRQSGDYEDFVYCDLELFNELRPQAENFIKTISRLINKNKLPPQKNFVAILFIYSLPLRLSGQEFPSRFLAVPPH